MTGNGHRVVVVGAGITGLAAAHRVLRSVPDAEVTILEADDRVGGLIRTSPFAGLDHVDEGADAFLVRVPWARELAVDVGLGEALTAPEAGHASIWHQGLHRIPSELVLGVPAGVSTLASSGLFSLRGRLRAAVEPLLPRTNDAHDCIGYLVRRRFGAEVHERLVDPLVGSIYAADTDHFSLEAVPQIASLATSRSLLLAAQRARSAATGGQVFATPLRGMAALTGAVADAVTAAGATIRTSCRVSAVERDATGFSLAVESGATDTGGTVAVETDMVVADAVVLATPAHATAELVRPLSAEAHRALSLWHHASVALITIAVPARQWPGRLDGSGYLVPKPDQRWVTAASFGSNKWGHWRPADGSQIVRVSLGRDGVDVLDHDDESLVNLALADLKQHLDLDLAPTAVRVSRWPLSFPQYRPGHFVRLADLESTLRTVAPGLVLAGASYRGIGIPACVQQANDAATQVERHLRTVGR